MSVENLNAFPHTVGNLDDRPNLAADDMKAAFEQDCMDLWNKVREVIPDLNAKLPASDIVKIISSASTDEKVPTAKAVYSAIADALLGAGGTIAEAIITDWLDDHPEATTTVADGAITNAKLATSFATPGVAQEYDPASTYTLGDVVYHNKKLYMCNVERTEAEAWTAAHWSSERQLGAYSLIARGGIGNGMDCDSLAIGSYFKDAAVEALNGVNTNMALVISFRQSAASYAKAQLWYDCVENNLYYRSKAGASSAWSGWTKVVMESELDKAVINRTAIEPETDLDTVDAPGLYYCPPDATIVNKPTGHSGRLVCFCTPNSTNSVQLYFDATNSHVFYRVRVNADDEWQDWGRLVAWSEIADIINYPVDPSTLGWSFGGVTNTGGSNDSDTRLRMRGPDGKGAVFVKAGSKVTAAEGYKFNCAVYSRYKSVTDNELIDFRYIAPGSFTAAQDCFIRIGIGTTNDDVLWTVDDEGLYKLTQDGELAASGALIFELIAETIKDAVDDLRDSSGGSASSVYELEDEIPLTSAAYYSLWDDMVASGIVARTQLTTTAGSDPLPVYMYTMRSHMDHVGDGYLIVPWDGSNELYTRPKILITAGQHGNERTPPVAVWDFARHMAYDPEYQSMRDAFDWYFIPLVNPWGFSHTEYKGGTMRNGAGYTGPNGEYVAAANTATYHTGIRRNELGIDINRDFTVGVDSVSNEATAIRTALSVLTNNGQDKFVFAIDCHQASGAYDDTTDVGARCAFMSLSYSATQADKNLIYNRFMQGAATSMSALANRLDVDPAVQTMYPWVGSNQATLRNYAATYARYSTCYEGGQTCAIYSGKKGLSNWSNSMARAVVNTQLHNALKRITDLWV